jgi:ribosome-binding factor A
MTLDKRTREELLAYCGQLQPDDAVDPREFFKPQASGRKSGRKALQLCKQVAETLQMVLSGELSDERLQGLEVVSVEPAPNSSQLAVTVAITDRSTQASAEEVLACLQSIAARLRSEVAEAITRKRAPRLVFRVIELPAGTQ